MSERIRRTGSTGGAQAKPRKMTSSSATLLSDDDLYFFNEGSHLRLYDRLGSHPMTVDGVEGTYFAVWAPNAERVFVMGDFNGWDKSAAPLLARGQSGIWEGFVPGLGRGVLYKYHVVSRHNGYQVDKADPFARFDEVPPKTASVVWELDYEWGDQEWMAARGSHNALRAPYAVYELSLIHISEPTR